MSIICVTSISHLCIEYWIGPWTEPCGTPCYLRGRENQNKKLVFLREQSEEKGSPSEVKHKNNMIIIMFLVFCWVGNKGSSHDVQMQFLLSGDHIICPLKKRYSDTGLTLKHVSRLVSPLIVNTFTKNINTWADSFAVFDFFLTDYLNEFTSSHKIISSMTHKGQTQNTDYKW